MRTKELTRLEASRGWVPLQLAELWAYRELLYFLAWRDIKVRYKQTILGVAWAVMVPFTTMIVFNVLFGLLMGQDNKPTVPGVPYSISTYCALVPWQLFFMVINQSSSSIIRNRGMITKVYFPRLIAPLAPVFAALVDFAIAFLLLIALIAGYHIFTDYTFVFSFRLLVIPVFVLLLVLTGLSLSLWLSAANAIYRDVQYVIPFIGQLLMFVSPVLYPSSKLISEDTPTWVQLLYGMNPVAGIMDGFRWAILGSDFMGWAVFIPSVVMMVVLFVGGLFYFRRMERTFADLA